MLAPSIIYPHFTRTPCISCHASSALCVLHHYCASRTALKPSRTAPPSRTDLLLLGAAHLPGPRLAPGSPRWQGTSHCSRCSTLGRIDLVRNRRPFPNPALPSVGPLQLLIFVDRASKRFYLNRKKAMRLRWTQAWRRAHKKIRTDKTVKNKLAKKTAKVFKTFAGISLEDLKAKSTATSDVRKAQKEAQDRAAKATAAKKAAPAKAAAAAKKPVAPKVKEFVKVPKTVRLRNKTVGGRK